jgi:hypothetical protein
MSELARLDRPHIEFVNQLAIPWARVGMPALGDLEHKVLSAAPDGSGTLLIRFTPGGSGSLPLSENLFLQLLVLWGDVEIAGNRLEELYHLRVGGTDLAWASQSGAVVLCFLDNVSWPAIGEPAVVVDSGAVPWRVATDAFFAPGAARKDIWTEPTTGEELFLLGTLPLRWNRRAQVHPVVEEVFVLAGELVGPNGIMTPGTYLWRPAGVWHGPFGQYAGTLLMIRSPGGPLTKTYADVDSSVPSDPTYAPVMPHSLERLGAASAPVGAADTIWWCC